MKRLQNLIMKKKKKERKNSRQNNPHKDLDLPPFQYHYGPNVKPNRKLITLYPEKHRVDSFYGNMSKQIIQKLRP